VATITDKVKAAWQALGEDPLDPALQGAFAAAVREQREADEESKVPQPIGTTYPRTDRQAFTPKDFMEALAYGVVRYGVSLIAWTRISHLAFGKDDGTPPGWVGPSTAPTVVAGRLAQVDPWRIAKVDRATGEVRRIDSNVWMPILSSPVQNPAVVNDAAVHPLNPAVVIKIDADGFPEFNPVAEVLMPYDQFRSGDKSQFKYCDQKITEEMKRDSAFKNKLPGELVDFYEGRSANATFYSLGYVWHHHQHAGRMQLVRVEDHDAVVLGRVKHCGGASIWSAVERHPPRDARTGARRRHYFKTLLTTTERVRKRKP
jgi:hypothetical protein